MSCVGSLVVFYIPQVSVTALTSMRKTVLAAVVVGPLCVANVCAMSLTLDKSARLIHRFPQTRTFAAQAQMPLCAVVGVYVWQKASVNARGWRILQKDTVDVTVSAATLTVRRSMAGVVINLPYT